MFQRKGATLMIRLRKSLLLGAAILTLLLGPLALDARAAFIAGYSGNTLMGDVPATDGVVSFAVYDNTGGGNWITTLGLGTAIKPVLAAFGLLTPPTGTELFVYFYQVVNVNLA